MSVRHDEGKVIHTLRKHTSAVSVLTLANDEKSVLSGSWDRNVYDWDLNTGQTKRDYTANAGQVSSIQFRPTMEGVPWEDVKPNALVNGVSRGASRPATNGLNGVDPGVPDDEVDAPGSPAESTRSFGSLFGDDDDMGIGGDQDDPMNQAIKDGLDRSPAQQQPNGDSSNDSDVAMGDGVAMHVPLTNGAELQANNSVTTVNGGTNGAHTASTSFASSGLQPSGSTDQNLFLVSSMDGTLRIWDRRAPLPAATSTPAKGVPPWCMQACWSTDGNWLYAGRRNGTVEEFSVYKGIQESTRTLKFPGESGAVSSLWAMPNGRHLIWHVVLY